MPGSRQRFEVRHELTSLFETLLIGAADSGSATTLVDADELTDFDDNALRGRHVFIYSGTGVGQDRRISANTQSSGTITVPTAWVTNPAAGSLYEIHNMFQAADLNRAINRAISDIRNDSVALVAIVPDTSLKLATDTWRYAVPVNLRWIERIEMETSTAGIYGTLNALWEVEKTALATAGADATYQIVFDWNHADLIAERKLKLYGAVALEPLLTDTALLPEGLEPYVVHRAAYYLLAPKGRGGSPAASQIWKEAQLHYNDSEKMRALPPPYIPASGAVELPR